MADRSKKPSGSKRAEKKRATRPKEKKTVAGKTKKQTVRQGRKEKAKQAKRTPAARRVPAGKTASSPVKPKVVSGRPKKSAAGPSREDILRKQLISSREDIVREAKAEIAKYIKGETRQLVESVLDDGDWSVIDLSEDINLRRLATHREVLLKIDEALRKLKEGTYGICEDCGEDINTERLKVLPFAIYCRDCQEKREEIEKIESEEL